MTRTDLIQEIIDKKGFKRYLEIGTYKGESFFPINCKYKVAVDPQFNIPIKRKIKWIVKNANNVFNRFFEHTSDSFFDKHEKFLSKFKPQVVFVDGLHTFKASLLDVLNSLRHLDENGVIVMHDCMPPNRAASTFANSFKEAIDMKLEGWTGEWTGDVWKTIVYLNDKYGDKLKLYVLDTDYGLGYIETNVPIEALHIDESIFNRVNKLTFDDLLNDTSLINLFDKSKVNELQ